MNFEEMTVPQLRKHAKNEGISLTGLRTKPDIVTAIKKATEQKEPPTPPSDGKASTDGNPPTPPENVPNNSTISRVLRVIKPLMKGADVKAVQETLISKDLHCGATGANGRYNASTALAVKLFQAQSNLPASGRIEKNTATALGLTWTGK